VCGCHTAHAEGNLLLCLIRLDAWDAPWQSWGRSMRLADRRQWNSLGPVHRPQVADDPLVAVGAWEALKPGHWPDYPAVCKDLQQRVGGVRVYFVCGTDHATKCGLWKGMGEIGVVVVPRADDKPKPEEPAKRVFVARPAEGEAAGFSSTQVRKALAAKDFDAASRFLSAGAAQFVLRPSVGEFAAFAKDFEKVGVTSVPPAPPAPPSQGAGHGPRTIGITGLSRSGKGWVSGALKAHYEAQGRSVAVIGQDGYWRKPVEVSVRGKVRRSEEEAECTDHQAFSEAIRKAVHGMAGSGGVVIAEGFQLVHSPDVTAQLDVIFEIDIEKEEARRRRCQAADKIKNPNPMSVADWDDLVWPAHVRYVESSLAPLASRVHKLKSPESEDDVKAIVRTILRIGWDPFLQEVGL